MKNTRIVFLASLLALVLPVLSYGDVLETIKANPTQTGEQAYPWNAGGSYARVVTSNEILISSGPTLLLGVVMSTGAVTSYVTFRDTDATNGSGTTVIERLQFQVQMSSYPSPYIQFPLRFPKGLTAQVFNIDLEESVTIIYRPYQ